MRSWEQRELAEGEEWYDLTRALEHKRIAGTDADLASKLLGTGGRLDKPLLSDIRLFGHASCQPRRGSDALWEISEEKRWNDRHKTTSDVMNVSISFLMFLASRETEL